MPVDFLPSEKIAVLSWPSERGDDEPFEMTVRFPFEFDPQHSKQSDYVVGLFRRAHLVESDIKELFSKGEAARLGWWMPLQAIESDDHDYADNPYFSIYAGRILQQICDHPSLGYIRERLQASDQRSVVQLTHVLEANILAVCLYKPWLRAHDSLETFEPSLLEYGLVPFLDCSAGETWIGSESFPASPRVQLRRSTFYEHASQELKDLLRNVLPCQDDSVIKFFLLYQVVEYLIDKIFEKQGLETFRKIRALPQPSVQDVRELVSEIQQVASEISRIASLFDQCSFDGELASSFRAEAATFLLKCGVQDSPEDLAKLFYKIRNQVVHRTYGMSTEARISLSELSKLALPLVSVMMQDFDAQPE